MIKKPNVIVFDVDNTLIKGNLTFCFLRFLMKENIYFFKACLPLVIHGTILLLRQIPKATKSLLLKEGNVYKFDRSMYQKMTEFYKHLFTIFKNLNLLQNNLEQKASQLFTKDFFRKRIYPEAIEKIKHHLQKKNNIVVLLSGSTQEILNIFFKNICDSLTETNIPWNERFFVLGTKLEENTNPCIGSEKNNRLKQFLKEIGHETYNLQFIYSDNSFMADLPLLIEAENGGALICQKTKIYEILPKKLLESLIFLPFWKKQKT